MKKNTIAKILLVLIAVVLCIYIVHNTKVFQNVSVEDQTAAANRGTLVTHFKTLGSMQYARSGHLATKMKDGRVLIVGGTASMIPAEIYNPSTKTFTVAATPLTMQYGWNGSLVALIDGRVLHSGDGTSEIYDPIANTWTLVDSTDQSLQTLRVIGNSVSTQNNLAVLIGGRSTSGYRGIAKIAAFDPVTNFWSDAGEMINPRYEQCSIGLTSGKIWTAMGLDENANDVLSTELYDPSTKTSTPSVSVAVPRDGAWVFPLCTALPNNKAFIGGGTSPTRISTAYYDAPIASTEIFDATANTISPGPSMLEPHGHGVATTLQNGSVLVTGGYKLGSKGKATDLSSAELYNGTSFVSAGKMTIPRKWHTATLLNDGTVLIASDGTAELYIP